MPTSSLQRRFGTEDVRVLLEGLGKCVLLKDFRKEGKAHYWKEAKDGLRHGVEFDIRRWRNVELDVIPRLYIDHELARRLVQEGTESDLLGSLTSMPLWEVARQRLQDRGPGGYTLFLPVVKELWPEPMRWRQEWRTKDEFHDFIAQIVTDLDTVGRQFFDDLDTILKVIHWLKTDTVAGYAYKTDIIVALHYVQGQTEKCLEETKRLAKERPTPVNLRFADYIAKKIEEETTSS